MNTVKVFAEGVAEQISNYLPEELHNMEFTVIENTKNNGVVLTGLNVHIPGENISPVIYKYYCLLTNNRKYRKNQNMSWHRQSLPYKLPLRLPVHPRRISDHPHSAKH